MTGASDGVIRVFRNYDNESKTELVTAYRALTDLVDSSVNAGMVFDWQQGQGKVVVAGDVKVIRVWNALTEMCTSVSGLPADARRGQTDHPFNRTSLLARGLALHP